MDIESLLACHKIRVSQRIAVFDLDDTLIDGDIGDAVFARLKLDETDRLLTLQQEPLALDWGEYRTLIKTGKKQEAYRRVVTCMAGMPLSTLVECTRSLIRTSPGHIKIEGETLPIPAVKPEMAELLKLLRKLKYRIMVISASNHFSVRIAAGELLKLPRSRAFGIRPKISFLRPDRADRRMAVLTGTLHEPVPWACGKADLYTRLTGGIPPLISGGDSESDLFLLNLTHPLGLAIWAGRGGDQPRKMFRLHPGP
jgi:hypothetical protein